MSGGPFRCVSACVCVYSALCVSVGYIEGAVLVHLLFKCVCVRARVRMCAHVRVCVLSRELSKLE